MMKIPIKTHLPLKVWALAALVTLYSLVSSLVQGPAPTNDTAPSMAHATLASGSDSPITAAVH